MGVDAHVTSSTRQRLAFPVWYMLLCLRVSILFGHTKVHHMYHIRRLRAWSPDKEIIWFDVSVYEVLFMYCLYSGKLECC